MAPALVGTAGVATQGAVTTPVTPAWGTGETRAPGNLLLLFVTVTAASSAPGSPAGWSSATKAGTSCNAAIMWKIAAGSDAAPTLSAVVGGLIAAHLEEWTGCDTSTGMGGASAPSDFQGNAVSTTSPCTATMSFPSASGDTYLGELVAMAGADFRSVARASNDTWTSNNGTPTLQASNNGVNSTDHYSHATLVTTGNASADTAVMTLSITTSITGLAVQAVSFLLGPPPYRTWVHQMHQLVPQ